jgi:hypothetical protein
MKKNVFVVGLDDFNLSQLQSLRHAAEFRFHSLIDYVAIKGGPRFPVESFLQQAQQTLDNFPGSVDAIVGYWDFPVSTILPVLRQRYKLPGPTLEAVLKLEHKYWSRVLQQEVVPDMVPPFTEVDPFAADAAERITLDYPYWLKPVKSASSYLGFRIHNRQELDQALEAIRAGIGRFADPFNRILKMADLPPQIAAIDGNHCIAEGIISVGKQCTLEGYVQNGGVTVYGIVDSIREGKHRSCFARYQYPSIIPRHVQQRMIDATARVLQHMGYDNSPFNVEYYWDRRHDKIWLLEFNARISKSHCPVFKLVDGEYHHAIMIDVALGRTPDFPHRKGHFKMAAKFMVRRYRDGLVKRVPSQEDIARVQQRYPDTEVLLHIPAGMRLSDLRDQDSYSYEIAVVYLGAGNQAELLSKYHGVLDMLPFEIDEVG